MSHSEKRFDCITLGESMALFAADTPGDLSQVSHYTRHIAGAESNVAIGLARLGLNVAWLSRLGGDEIGRFVRQAISSEGVSCDYVSVHPQESTGLMFKTMSSDGADPKVEYYRQGSAASRLSVQDFPIALLKQTRHIHLTGIMPALSDSCFALSKHILTQAKACGVTTSFDPNLRPGLWGSTARMQQGIHALAALADWVMPGQGEAKTLTGLDDPEQIADFYLQLGASHVIVKLGAEGAFLKNSAGVSLKQAAFPVPKVCDTVGAGDGFAVGVISAKLDGLGWQAALARGAWIGAQQVQVKGDVDGLPKRIQLPASLQV
ncbi:MAG: sugar kinase [Burkholderiaceae bacterium]|nr:sugar kinase [Burkholderiaceae bacterium]